MQAKRKPPLPKPDVTEQIKKLWLRQEGFDDSFSRQHRRIMELEAKIIDVDVKATNAPINDELLLGLMAKLIEVIYNFSKRGEVR